MERVTRQGATIDRPETGIHISIPEHAVEANIDLTVHPCFSGPFQLPAAYKSASPAYLIKPSRKIKIMKEVTIQIHHHESLETEEDCEEMKFFSASYPEKKKTVYTFKKIQKSKETFETKSQIGELKLKHFCLIKVGRRRRGRLPEESGRESK